VVWLLLEAVSGSKDIPVTYGSAVKLKIHLKSRFLFSLPAQWSEGRQVVTGSGNRVDPGTYWLVVPETGAEMRTEVPCESNFRLQHVNTQHYLSLSSSASEISGNPQVIADSQGSVLRLRCSTSVWRRSAPVQIFDASNHAVRLGLSGVEYSQRNCPNCVINGDAEISHSTRLSDMWVVDDGILFEISDLEKTAEHSTGRDEL
jgi:hypothetical protein